VKSGRRAAAAVGAITVEVEEGAAAVTIAEAEAEDAEISAVAEVGGGTIAAVVVVENAATSIERQPSEGVWSRDRSPQRASAGLCSSCVI
jgi:hypothetical protein